MMAELKPYPTMKDSGVEWLGMVPEHWEILPKYDSTVFSEVIGTVELMRTSC